MKRCPECGRDYDNTMMFCLDDGAELLYGPAKSEPGAVATGLLDGDATRPQIYTTDQTAIFSSGAEAEPSESLGGTAERQSLSANRAAQQQEKVGGRRGKVGSRQMLLAAFGIVALVLVGGFFGYRYFSPSSSGTINSIAVLPFQNAGGNSDADYLSDGLAESLIYRLSQLPNLKVSPTSSVFRYMGKESDPQNVAKELGVDSVMTGRITQRGDDMTISVNLVDTRDGKSLWGEQYERKLSDILSTQREIAAEIAKKLQLKLSGEEIGLTKNYTDSSEAYQLYMKGRYQWNRRTAESLKYAVEFFNQAIEKDPNFALAYSGLAESYTLFSSYSVDLPLDSMPKAKEAALRAIELDDSLAEPHVALGIYYADFAWNQPKAEQEFRRAIERNPNYATAHQQFGIECLTAMGRFDEAIAEGRRAVELDPLSLIIGADLGNILTRARRQDEAIEQLNHVLSLDPNFYVAYWYLGTAYNAKRQYPESIAAYKKALSLNDNPFVKALLVQSLAQSGQRPEAVKLLEELQAESTRRYVSGSSLAMAYAAIGDKDKAFIYLEKEVVDRASRPQLFSVFSIWDDLRDDPRFAALIRKVEQSKLD